MPRGKRAKRRNQPVSDADSEVAIHSDERSMALLATTLNIASGPEMKVGAKRALAECLETDGLDSEVVHDSMWTGNSPGLSIARENAKVHMLESHIQSILARLRKLEDTDRKHSDHIGKQSDQIRKLEDTDREQQQTISDLHHTLNQVGQRDNVRNLVGFCQIRSRFLSTFKRDVLENLSSEDRVLIGQGNIVAHNGNFRGDAMLYEPDGFVGEDGKRLPPRDDYHVFKELYGVDPSLAARIDYTPTVLLLEKHATIVSSLKFQTADTFKERFNAYILSLEASDYASDYLDSHEPELQAL